MAIIIASGGIPECIRLSEGVVLASLREASVAGWELAGPIVP